MLRLPRLAPGAELPLYRQLFEHIRSEIESGYLRDGERLPATRDLAVQIGLNRTTVSAAYVLLEEAGLIEGQVGRGSYVRYRENTAPAAPPVISFASSRPCESDFPMAAFEATVAEVVGGRAAAGILQLGATAGYPALREYLLEEARSEGLVQPGDDILIVSGCQQALDLVARVFAAAGTPVAIEDPVYHGLRYAFSRSGARLLPMQPGDGTVPAGAQLAVVTPDFQNPTGITWPAAERDRLAGSGVQLVENAIYSPLRYMGEAVPALKTVAPATILIRSFSKIAFPGLRVGWVIAPAPAIARLAEAKQWADLHTDQLSQAILLRFCESGRLAAHLERVRAAGAKRLAAVLTACARHLPPGSRWTRPEGGLNLWVTLPAQLDAAALLPAAEREGVTYLPGSHFAVGEPQTSSLRLCFGALEPEAIGIGLERLGRVFAAAPDSAAPVARVGSAPAVV